MPPQFETDSSPRNSLSALIETRILEGNAFYQAGRPEEALASYDEAIALQPGLVDAHNNRGHVLYALKRYEEALASFENAIALMPDHASALNNCGNVLNKLQRHEEALVRFAAAIASRPDYADACNNRGNALWNLKRHEEALASYDRAIALKPEDADIFSNRGNALWDLKRFEEALASYEKAIALKPGLADAYYNRSQLLLSLGFFEQGLREFEFRVKSPNQHKFLSRRQPPWLGEQSIAGKTLLIHQEKFIGDVLFMCRYAKLAEDRGAKVILMVQASLHKLLGQLSPSIRIISENEEPPLFDYHCPLMSLPLAFKTMVNTIVPDVPYLRAEAARVRKWKERLGDDGFKIGISWQGSTLPYAARLGRSCPLQEFFNVSRIPNVRLISLQKGAGVEQLSGLPHGMQVEALGEDFDAGPDAFLDTAAVLESLDLVITVDTSIAHLAGALARPTWVVLKYVPDWRWLLDREDSPWYPTMRLFRQQQAGDWRSAIAAMEKELSGCMGEGNSRLRGRV